MLVHRSRGMRGDHASQPLYWSPASYAPGKNSGKKPEKLKSETLFPLFPLISYRVCSQRIVSSSLPRLLKPAPPQEETMAKLINWDECAPLHQRDDRTRLEEDLNIPEFPSLCRPVASIRDAGTARLGDGFITAEFPPHT